MALSSISGAAHGAAFSNRNAFIPTRALATVQSGSHGTTGRGGDTFHCATCGGQKVSPSLAGRQSFGISSARTSNPLASTYGNHCPTCSPQTSRSAGVHAGAIYFHGPKTGVR